MAKEFTNAPQSPQPATRTQRRAAVIARELRADPFLLDAVRHRLADDRGQLPWWRACARSWREYAVRLSLRLGE